MKYYKINYDVDAMGWVPQSETQHPKLYKPKDDEVSIVGFLKKRDKISNLQNLLLNHKANLTDRINCVYISDIVGLVLSDKLIAVFESFNLPKHYTRRATFIQSGKIINGYQLLWTHNANIYTEALRAPYQNQKSELYRLIPDKVYLSSSCCYDFLNFYVSRKGGGLLVSENLKKKIGEVNATGFAFEEIDWLE